MGHGATGAGQPPPGEGPLLSAGRAGPQARALEPATLSEHAGVRYLHLGTPWVQGAMRLSAPAKLELEYVRRMMAWLLMRPAAQMRAGHAVQLGLGAAAITRYCHGVLRMRTTAVEINPSVIDACRLWFRLPADSARLQVLQMDAALYVADRDRVSSASVLSVDLYDQEAASPVLDSAAFYRDCARLLAPDGVMAVNLFGRDASFETSAGRIAAAFGHDRVLRLAPTAEGNTIVLALKSGTLPGPDELAARAENIETRLALPAKRWARMVRPLPRAPTGLTETDPAA